MRLDYGHVRRGNLRLDLHFLTVRISVPPPRAGRQGASESESGSAIQWAPGPGFAVAEDSQLERDDASRLGSSRLRGGPADSSPSQARSAVNAASVARPGRAGLADWSCRASSESVSQETTMRPCNVEEKKVYDSDLHSKIFIFVDHAKDSPQWRDIFWPAVMYISN